MVDTYVNYAIGTGPRLQMLTDDPDINRKVENLFFKWCKAVKLSQKLRLMRTSKSVSGEVFSIFTTNDRVDDAVKLDIIPVEADRVTSPLSNMLDETAEVDGIKFDATGNPTKYYVLNEHPGSNTTFNNKGFRGGEWFDASDVIHLFRADRPGQSRGVSEIAPALSLFALLRRYTLAVVTSAEHAAIPSGLIHTDASADEAAAQIDELDVVDVERGTMVTLPRGWDVRQLKAEQPTSTYGDFKGELINEVARTLNMPKNIAAGNSSDYNYASGRLDQQSFVQTIKIDRVTLEEDVLDRVFINWIGEASLISGYLPQQIRTLDADITHQWFWDGFLHVDPVKESKAQTERLSSLTTSLATEYAAQGKDWEKELQQIAREKQLKTDLGLSVTPPAESKDEVEDEVEEGVDDE